MSHDPWRNDIWSERQAAWFLAELPEIEFAAWKVEGELDDAFPQMGAHPDALAAWLESGDQRDLGRWRPLVVGPPLLSGPAKDAARAHECLELLRTAVKWRRLRIINDEVMFWDGQGLVRKPIEDMPADVVPVRFKIERQELIRWWETDQTVGSSRGSSKDAKAPNGFYVAALRLAEAGGAELKASVLLEELSLHGSENAPGKNTLRPAVRAARSGEAISYYEEMKGSSAKKAYALLEYALRCHGENLDDKPDPIQYLKKLFHDHNIEPLPTSAQWGALGL